MSQLQNFKPLTFEQIPEAIGEILIRLEQIEQLLANKAPPSAIKPPITTKELCKFLGVTQPTIARYKKKQIIPYLTIGSAIRFDLDKVIAALENKKKKM
jgi:excisionase family DNA binding protein